MKLMELKILGFSVSIGVCRIMETVSQTSSVSKFILLRLSSDWRTKSYILPFSSSCTSSWWGTCSSSWPSAPDTHVFFLWHLILIDVCYTTIVPKMLMNFLSKKKSYAECMIQMYFSWLLPTQNEPPGSHGHLPLGGHL